MQVYFEVFFSLMLKEKSKSSSKKNSIDHQNQKVKKYTFNKIL